MSRGRFISTLGVLSLSMALGLRTAAQTSTDLVTDPWDTAPHLRVAADGFGQSTQVTDATNPQDLTLIVGRGEARLRLASPDFGSLAASLPEGETLAEPAAVLSPPPGEGWSPALGFEFVSVTFDGDGPGLPARLVRQEIAVGLPLDPVELLGHTWRPGATLGLGHASTNPFADGQGWYALGSAFIQRPLADGSTLLLGVTYDGNRSTLPDVPLPLFEYRRPIGTGGGELGLTLGYPEARITYRPDDRLTLSAGFDRLDWATIDARYHLTDRLTAYAQYAAFYDMFHDADDQEHRRLFFLTQRLEAGVVVEPRPGVGVTMAGGYAFDQELRRGYDWRSTARVLEFDDAPFARLGLTLRF